MGNCPQALCEVFNPLNSLPGQSFGDFMASTYVLLILLVKRALLI
jgi:hypothetical protein